MCDGEANVSTDSIMFYSISAEKGDGDGGGRN